MDCIFCKISAKEIPAEFLFENEQIVVFKDIHPSAPVHLLVVPKEHIQSISHLQGNHKEIISELIYSAKLVAERQNLKGYKLVFNVGREGGQVIDHLHLHLLGGWTRKAEIEAMPHPSLDK
ncbi:MAG TPA: histidine triad nucleotide-binding protein [Candidatus Paceibacterota bacterium]